MDHYFGNIVHVDTVTMQVQLSQTIVRARIVKETHCSHLIADYQLVRTQTTQSCYLVLAAVRVVDALCAGRKSQCLLLPLDSHLHENGIDASVVLFEADHADFLISILEQ